MPNNAGASGTATVTMEQLKKSLSELEGKPETPAAEAEPQVEMVAMLKSVDATVTEKGTERLRKALDVSEVLGELADTIGVHVDEALEELRKSVNENREFGLQSLRVMTTLAKSVKDLSEKVEKFGAQPVTAAGTKTGTTESVTVLAKGADAGALPGQEKKELDARQVRKQVIVGLETLYKSASSGSVEQAKWLNTTSKFESTGEISEVDMATALNAAKKLGQ